jgi:hypothetical protein
MPNWYREALEAVGRTGRKSTIRNKLNVVATKSEDETLRLLATDVILQFDFSGLNTDHTSLLDSKSVKTDKLVTHCQERAYS